MSVSFKEFMKISFRIGRIIEIEDHPDADKLYVLKVDLGDKTVQLVAGVKLNYSKEELRDKQIVVLDNLETKSVRGIESQGMLLAADTPDGPIILSPEKKAPVGSPVR